MTTKHTLFLIFCLLLIIGFMACNADRATSTTTEKVQKAAAPPDCDRACLEGFANQYLDALVAHDPSRVPLAQNVKFTENGQELAVGDALWATASDLPTTYRIYFTDPKTGQVGFNGLMKENGKLILISFRLKLAQDKKVAEIEQIVARDDGQFFGGKSLTTPDPIYAEILKPEERSSREDMITIGDSYFKALERMDGTRPVPFADTCNRFENGMQTTNNPKLFGASDGGFNIGAMSCTEQFKTGYLRFVTQIRRRHLVVDEERGIVSSTAILDHAGNIKEVTLTDGRTVPIGLSSPTSLLGGGFFKIKGGKIHRIHTILTSVPYGMKPGW
jgi:hypothetical protein